MQLRTFTVYQPRSACPVKQKKSQGLTSSALAIYPNANGGKVPWTWISKVNTNALFSLQGRNFHVTDNDLYATWQAFNAGASYDAKRFNETVPGWSTAQYGVITNNQISNGAACYWFDTARENQKMTILIGNKYPRVGIGY